MIELYLFLYIFAFYSVLRYIDVWSTRLATTELNFEMHEVNPLVVPFVKKMGFKKAMIVTWLLFAIPISIVDIMVVYPLIGFPMLWVMFGLLHILAAANNIQVYFQTKTIGADNVELNTRNLVRKLRSLSTLGKITHLMKLNFFNLCLAIYGLAALTLTSMLLNSLVISFKEPTSFLLVIVPPVMILDLVLFFPVIVFGSIIISYRQLKIFNNKDISSEENGRYVSIPRDVLHKALVEAEKNGADFIQFFIPHED